jgi:hypothetical protein
MNRAARMSDQTADIFNNVSSITEVIHWLIMTLQQLRKLLDGHDIGVKGRIGLYRLMFVNVCVYWNENPSIQS